MGQIVTGGLEQAPPWLIDKLDKFFRNQEIAEANRVEKRQNEIAKFMQTGRKSIDGLGRPVMELDEFVLAKWREKLGYNPVKDHAWRKYMLKHFPQVGVHAIGTKEIHVGWAPGMESSQGKKFYSKKY